ncbi:MAG: TetR/AcrR family transcriptional regulator [Coriobacteriaceae bacterium]|nr:TetR/AcrR family transcriptional regulator [Coriobacteriaceae bacterium]
MPYEKITITMVCAGAHVSRTAFYSFFSSKEDLVQKLVDDDIIQPIHALRELLPTQKIESAPRLITEKVYQGFTRNKDYYAQVAKIDDTRLLFDCLTKKLTGINQGILEKSPISDQEKYYAAYFFAASNAVLIIKWIENGMDVEPATLASLYNKWTQHYWHQVVPFQLDWE